MNCDQVKILLSTYKHEPTSPQLLKELSAHVGTCAECATYRQRAERLDQEASRIGASEAPNLLPRIELELARSRRSQPRWALASAMVAALAFIAVAGIGLSGKPAYGALDRMRLAVKAQHSMHEIMMWRPDNSTTRPLELVEETWYQDGKWRRKSPEKLGGERIFLTEADGVHYFRRFNGKVADMRELAQQGNRFDLDHLAPIFFPTNASLQRNGREPFEWKGRQVEKWQISTADDSERMICYVLPGTNLPVHLEKLDKYPSGWVTFGTIDLDFDTAIPASMFDPTTLPPNNPRP